MHSTSRLCRMSPAALLVAVLALVVAAAGAGYTAGKVGTSDLENNAVTSKKVKNGTLKNADLVKDRKFRYLEPGDFEDGGQGDCIWTSAEGLLTGLGAPGYRKDRFGTVHLVGAAVGADGPGGDGDCDLGAEPEDAVVTILPRSMWPANTQIHPFGTAGAITVAGEEGLPEAGLPPGAVRWSGLPAFGVVLDGISYQPRGSKLVKQVSPAAPDPGLARRLLR